MSEDADFFEKRERWPHTNQRDVERSFNSSRFMVSGKQIKLQKREPGRPKHRDHGTTYIPQLHNANNTQTKGAGFKASPIALSDMVSSKKNKKWALQGVQYHGCQGLSTQEIKAPRGKDESATPRGKDESATPRGSKRTKVPKLGDKKVQMLKRECAIGNLSTASPNKDTLAVKNEAPTKERNSLVQRRGPGIKLHLTAAYQKPSITVRNSPLVYRRTEYLVCSGSPSLANERSLTSVAFPDGLWKLNSTLPSGQSSLLSPATPNINCIPPTWSPIEPGQYINHLDLPKLGKK